MPIELRYGVDSSLFLDLPDGALVAACDAPRGTPIVDTASAVADALDAPLDYPPLSKAVVPGDKVVLALDPGLPQAATIVAAVVKYLLENNIAAGDVTVLRTQADIDLGAEDPRQCLAEPIRNAVNVETHNPENRGHLGFLTTSHDGQPVYLNRTLSDADVVLPIGCLRCSHVAGYHGINRTVFPTFSDAKTLVRCRATEAADLSREGPDRSQAESDEVAWLLGARFTIQVIPGADGNIMGVLAGEVDRVFREGRSRCEAAWSYEVPRRASLVVASVAGDPMEQTWENLGRALAAASRAVAPDGAIAVCTDLGAEPGPAVQKLAQMEDRDKALRKIRKDCPADTFAAHELAYAQQRAKVYLLSRLDETFVEELGVSPIGAADEIARLARHHSSCIVLANAQYAVPSPVED